VNYTNKQFRTGLEKNLQQFFILLNVCRTGLCRDLSRCFGLIFLVLMLLLGFSAAGPDIAGATNLVHHFFLPLPESQIRTAMLALQSGTGTTIESVTAITVTSPDTIIHYDQWEDGYEVDLNNPTQPTTQIWGDGNDLNGIPPGFAHDPVSLTPGTLIVLRNQVPLPRNPSNDATPYLFDGRDYVGASKAIVITKAAWPIAPGPVLAGAVEVTATIDYGMSYISPVGQDVSASSMFEYVGMMIMAAEDGTTVTIDTDGTGVGAPFNVLLNRGESYQVNGGVKKGATVNSDKPVEVHLITGDINANYESRWYTLYPVEQWSDTYITPVGTASDGDQTYVFLYNHNGSSLSIDYETRIGSGNFTIPAYDTYQFLVPKDSGARFTSSDGRMFFALSTVGANPSSNNVHDWGFTLIPSGNLTPEAIAGWAPGSDGVPPTQNGNPIWVAAMTPTTLYVDYNGDHLTNSGPPLTDPQGNFYDVKYDLAALESKRIYDPDKDQSGMHVYTLDGALIAAAWGQDPAVAGPGAPFLDMGVTVLPFPIPLIRKTSEVVIDTVPSGPSIGDTVEYTLTVDNKGLLPLGNTIVTDNLPPQVAYVAGSTTLDGSPVPDSPSGTLFPLDTPGYTIPWIPRGGSSVFKFRVTIVSGGTISNQADSVVPSMTFKDIIDVQPPAGSTQCVLTFADSLGNPQTVYQPNADIYVKLTDSDENTGSGTQETMNITVNNASSGDQETITLTETGVNTGIFRNTGALPSSVSAGLAQQDGTINAVSGNSLTVAYTDPLFGDSCNASATIATPSEVKPLYLSDPSQALDRVDPVATSDSTTADSVTLGVTGGTVTVTGTPTSGLKAGTGAGTLSFSHTPGTGATMLLVGVSFECGSSSCNGGTSDPANTATFRGNAMTLVGRAVNSSRDAAVDIFRYNNPGTTAGNVVITLGLLQDTAAGAISFAGADTTQTLTLTSTNSNTGTPSITITSAAGEMAFAVATWDNPTGSPTAGGTTGVTSAWNARSVANDSTTGGIRGAASYVPGAASPVTLSWNFASGDWFMGGVSVKPSAGSGNTTTTFTQTPSMCSNLDMPSGGNVTIKTYYTMQSGSMTAGNINASLKYGATTFFTATGATAGSDGYGNYLQWTGTLSGPYTIPASGAVVLTIDASGLAAGNTFVINYDSNTKPSRIDLPTTTVISLDSLDVYDAAYPAGSVVTSAANGAVLYVRAAVSDPFGYNDITGLALTIDGSPVTASQVSSSTCSKVYEYRWATGPTSKTYDIVATAQEGTEGVNATRSTAVTLSVLDTGTPSLTEFTTGLNGADTDTYAGNEDVCIRITDFDQNTNASAIETVTAVITSSSGDSESVTLNETGVDTGIFAVCIPASTSGGGGSDSGTLNAPLASVLNASYTDPTDPTDTSGDTATVPPTTPGTSAVSIAKVRITPEAPDNVAVVGETVQFNLRVTNTGNTTLNTVSLTDTYPSANLTYQSASLAPDTQSSGSLTWNNLGPLTTGQSKTISIYFTAAAATASATNSASVGGDASAGPSTASVTITDPHLTITKTLTSPNPGPADKGGNVIFHIQVQNSGSSVIATLPIEDTFSAACFEYVSASPSPDYVNSGSLLWNDITGAGSLAVAGSTTIDVTLKAVGGCNPAVNTGRADYAVDANGDAVPSASGSANIVTRAGSISGTVYDDKDRSGTLTGGDVGLKDVSVKLYTDDGSGNPDTLIGSTTTNAAGYYEFLNLGTGNYIIVETDPPLYASSGDTAGPNDNHIPVTIVTLTAYTGNNFFDYVASDMGVALTGFPSTPDPGASVSGTVTCTNNGPSAAINATCTVTGLPGVPTVNCVPVSPQASLAVGSAIVCSVGFTAPASGVVTVTGHTGADNDSNAANNSADENITVNTADLSITKTDGVTSVDAGGSTSYTIVVTNNGPIEVTGATVVDTAPAGLTIGSWSCAVTNAGSGGTVTTACGAGSGSGNINTTVTMKNGAVITYTVPATVAGSASGSIANTATVTAPSSPTDHDTGNNSETDTDTVTPLADLSIVKTASDMTPDVDDNIIFTLAVVNNGPSTATGVKVTDILSDSVTWVSDDGGLQYDHTTGLWTIGTLTDGSSATLNITVKVKDKGRIVNIGSITSDVIDPYLTNNSSAITLNQGASEADLAVVKEVDNATPGVDDDVTFTITVTNNGPDNATGVALTDILPAGLTHQSDDSGGDYNTGTGVWTVGALNAAASRTLQIITKADNTGEIINTVKITASSLFDPDITNNQSSAVLNQTHTTIADLAVEKSVNLSLVDLGDNVTFAIIVRNNGPDDATGVSIDDTVPTGMLYVSSTASQGSYNDSTGVWDIGTIPAYGYVRLEIVATQNSLNTQTNTASIAATDAFDPNDENDSDDAMVYTVNTADLAITKTDGVTSVDAGGSTSYTIVVTNNGPSEVTGATVVDTAPAGLTIGSWSCAVTNAGSGGTVTTACGAGSGSGNINTTVTMKNGAVITYTVPATVSGSASGSIANTATVSVPTGTTDPTPGNNSQTDTDTVNTANPFDPPSGMKTVNPDGYPEFEWKMVWINNSNVTAMLVRVTDPIPTGTTYVPGSVQCVANGGSSTLPSGCRFDAANNRIVWDGNIAPDLGAIDEDTAANEVVITYRTTMPVSVTRVENQGCAIWDENNSGSLDDEIANNQVAVCTDDPNTDSREDPTVWESGVVIPTMDQWGLMIFMLIAGLGGVYYLRRRRGAGK
jgi:uncharacterized repeat protein (TIGR01451 family)